LKEFSEFKKDIERKVTAIEEEIEYKVLKRLNFHEERALKSEQ
jgi:hypothetical protein